MNTTRDHITNKVCTYVRKFPYKFRKNSIEPCDGLFNVFGRRREDIALRKKICAPGEKLVC